MKQSIVEGLKVNYYTQSFVCLSMFMRVQYIEIMVWVWLDMCDTFEIESKVRINRE